MRRRRFLAGGIALTATAGCLGDDNGDESETYEVGAEEALLPDAVGEEWPDEDFVPNHDLNPHFQRVWTTPGEDIIVLMYVEIQESVATAEESFEQSWATAADPEEYPLADDGLVADDGEAASCIFRHRNSNGQTAALRESGSDVQADRQRATSYAEILFDHWEF